MAEVALKQGKLAFAFFKYFELLFNSFEHSFINSLYLLEMYPKSVLGLTEKSWQPKAFAESKMYIKLRSMNLVPDVYTLLLEQYSPVGTKPFTLNQLDALFLNTKDID